jgi:Domain of unknown function (DUF5666)
MKMARLHCANRSTGIMALLIVFATAVFAVGCGSSMAGTATTPTPTATPQTKIQVKIGDAPAARVIAFEVTVGPITLTDDTGNATTVLSKTQRIELSHLSGTNEPLSLLNIPQGSYKSAAITVSSPEVTFINSAGSTQKIEPVLNQSIVINFSPSLAIGGSSAIVSIDVNVANSLTFDAQGNITGVNLNASSFSFVSSIVAQEDRQGHDDGELEDTTGTVTAINGTSFNLTVSGTGAQLTFTTDNKTEFEDGTSLSTLTVNSIVTVEGSTRSDGSLYARKVEGIENENGAEVEGLITSVTGSPATSLTFVTDHGTGSGMDDAKVGDTATADVSNARFEVKTGDIDTSSIGNLPSSEFPFDASSVHPGQRVEVESHDAMTGMTLGAEKVRLQQQALVGSVSGLSGTTLSGPATFTLKLPTDSAFSILSGQSTVHVLWQPGTDLHGLTAISNGDSIRVRGLVFFNGSTATIIARRIDK